MARRQRLFLCYYHKTATAEWCYLRGLSYRHKAMTEELSETSFSMLSAERYHKQGDPRFSRFLTSPHGN
jgi:hypothetical protein